MNRRRTKWIRRLFIKTDPGLYLSLGKILGDDFQKKFKPRTLYRKAKKMWNRNHPFTKTWGKGTSMKYEKIKIEGANNGRTDR